MRKKSKVNVEAEAKLAALLKKVNDPVRFRRSAAADDSAFEKINLAHDRLVRRSKAALRARRW